jgi:hypothetical protein
MGVMDCLTTVIGTVFFGTKELNPLIAELVATNLPVFVVLKLTVTVSVGIIFVLADRLLLKTPNIDVHSIIVSRKILNAAYITILSLLIVVVVNNVLVLLLLL